MEMGESSGEGPRGRGPWKLISALLLTSGVISGRGVHFSEP